MNNHSVGGLKKVVNSVRFRHMEKQRIVQSPWCLAVPVALVEIFFAACVHLEKQMSNHGVGVSCFAKCEKGIRKYSFADYG